MATAGFSRRGSFARTKARPHWYGCEDCGGPVVSCPTPAMADEAAKNHAVSNQHVVRTSTGNTYRREGVAS